VGTIMPHPAGRVIDVPRRSRGARTLPRAWNGLWTCRAGRAERGPYRAWNGLWTCHAGRATARGNGL